MRKMYTFTLAHAGVNPRLRLALPQTAHAQCGPTVTVTSTVDSGAGSLRQAIADVCTDGTIDFAAGLSGQTITLGSQLEITRGMTIRSTAPITVSGNRAVRVFNVSGGPVMLDGLTIAHGSAVDGAGIHNSGELTVTNSMVYSNVTSTYGGGMYNNGASPSLSNVVFRNNRANSDGGAMYNYGYDHRVSSPSLANVTFSGNRANSYGGAMYNNGNNAGTSSPSLVNVTFSGNQAVSGGAMFNQGYDGISNPSLVNVTFSGNRANYGGAMYNNGLWHQQPQPGQCHLQRQLG